MCLESWTNTKIYHLVTIDWCMQARQRNSVMDGFQLQLQLFRHNTKQCHVGTPVHKLTILMPTREISNRGRKKTFKSIQYLHSTFFFEIVPKELQLNFQATHWSSIQALSPSTPPRVSEGTALHRDLPTCSAARDKQCCCEGSPWPSVRYPRGASNLHSTKSVVMEVILNPWEPLGNT